MTYKCILACCFVIVSIVHPYYALQIEGEVLAKELRKFRDEGLGYTELQNDYNSLTYTEELLNGVELLKKLENELKPEFQSLKQAAKSIRDTVVAEYNRFSTTTGLPECKSTTGTPNLKFQANVSLDSACVTKSEASPDTSKYPSDAIGQKMKENMDKNPTLFWQHFGSEDGISVVYPRVNFEQSSSDYDPRFRPFYKSAATPAYKDVVIVIDTSGAMEQLVDDGNTKLNVVKDMARKVIDTTAPYDRLGVVYFNSGVQTPSGCYNNMLAIATGENKKALKAFINPLSTSVGSNYGNAIKEAFKFFKNSPTAHQVESKYQTILFLAGSNPSDGVENVLNVIRDENMQLNNKVTVLTYGIGSDIQSSTKVLLKDMSDQVRNNASHGSTKKGKYVLISALSNLRSKMTSFYSFFKSFDQHAISYRFSEPYVDTFSNIGLVLSVCLPAYKELDLLGVACADIKLLALFSQLDFFHDGESSYVFIIDQHGGALKHPLLQLPRTVRGDMPLRDISTLERDSGAQSVINSMKSFMSGSKSFKSRRTIARGSVLEEGINVDSEVSNYTWGPIEDTVYSLCVVIGEHKYKSVLKSVNIDNGDRTKAFLYHRRDLAKKRYTDCRNFKRLATREKSIIKFNANAFNEEGFRQYEFLEETQATVEAMTKYITGADTSNPNFKDNLLNAVLASYKAEKIWKINIDFAPFVIWRYYGSKDGFIRIYPGIEIRREYDHETRPWFKKGLSMKGLIGMTTPYVDSWGAGYLVSLVHTVQRGSNTNNNNEIDGVLGMDFSMPYFYQLILQIYPICGNTKYSCILVDNSGFIVMHKEFVSELERNPQLENVHLVSKEKQLAAHLIDINIMSRHKCTDFDNRKKQMTYRIRFPKEKHYLNETIDSLSYEMHPIKDSNLFIILKKTIGRNIVCCSNTRFVSPDIQECTAEKSCDCLCYEDVSHDSSSGCTITTNLTLPATCAAKTPDYSGTTVEDEKVDHLPLCFDPKCSDRNTKFSCYKVAGCGWCRVLPNNDLLSEPCCQSSDVCPSGFVVKGKECPGKDCQCGAEVTPSSPQETTTESTSEPLALEIKDIILIVLGLTTFICISTIGIFCYCRKCRGRRRKGRPEDDYLHAIPYGERAGPEGVHNPQYPTTYVHEDKGSEKNDIPMEYHANAYNSMPTSSSNSSGVGSTPNPT